MERFAELRSFLRRRGQLIPDFDLRSRVSLNWE